MENISLPDALRKFEYAFDKHPKFGTNIQTGEMIAKDVILLESNNLVKNIPPIKIGFYALSLCIEGESIHHMNQYSFHIRPYTLELITPNTLFHFEDFSEYNKRYIIFFTEDFIRSYQKQHVTKNIENLFKYLHSNVTPVNLSAPLFTRVLNIYEDINTELYDKEEDYTLIVHLLIFKLLFLLKRSKKEEEKTAYQQPTTRPHQIANHYLELIEKHFLECKKVADYSPYLNITTKHLGETIKEVLGKNALYYIHQRVLNEALYLLEYSNLSIKQIATALKYENQSEFSRLFKNYYKLTPKQFKLEILKKKTFSRQIV